MGILWLELSKQLYWIDLLALALFDDGLFDFIHFL